MGEQSFIAKHQRHRHRSFAEQLAHGVMAASQHALDATSVSTHNGYLQGLDPRIKLLGLLALIVSGVLSTTLITLAALFLLALALALSSHVGIARLCKQVWGGVFLFTGAIALPAIFIVPGEILAYLPILDWPISLQGLRAAAFLIGRAETAATFALLLVLTTPWTHVLKAMRSLGLPVVLVAILGMTHRYIFVLLQTAAQMFEARRSRILAPMSGAHKRQMLAATAGVLLAKSFQLSTEVHLAMLSRGYRGEVHVLHEFRTRWRDWIALLLALAIPGTILWIQR